MAEKPRFHSMMISIGACLVWFDPPTNGSIPWEAISVSVTGGSLSLRLCLLLASVIHSTDGTCDTLIALHSENE